MSSKHTPGPWEIEVGGEGGVSGRIWARVPAVARKYAKLTIAVLPEFLGRVRGEQEANVRLIAAAPDLLEALESTCERLEYFLHTLSTEGDRAWVLGEIRSNRAAIAKARGES
jgi:hypothetical protein